MWHASAAPTTRGTCDRERLQQRALKALAGVGDSAHEWHYWSGFAYHIRRQLTPAEAAQVEVKDVRGTPEAQDRYRRMAPLLPTAARQLAHLELRETS